MGWTRRIRSGGFWQVQGIEEIKLLGGGLAQAVEAAHAGVGGVFLDARQQRERAARAGTVPLGLQPHAHDAVEDERQEADQGVGADAVGQPMVNRRDRYVGFEDAEAALDVGLLQKLSQKPCQVESVEQVNEMW